MDSEHLSSTQKQGYGQAWLLVLYMPWFHLTGLSVVLLLVLPLALVGMFVFGGNRLLFQWVVDVHNTLSVSKVLALSKYLVY